MVIGSYLSIDMYRISFFNISVNTQRDLGCRGNSKYSFVNNFNFHLISADA